ncbi:MAG: hypothetical protein D3916_14205 [Candidatus Electrothrix sp. MAN1_4]|nr:hypothetical protein [Candidatus Electrothrix sp. MAN1_4]
MDLAELIDEVVSGTESEVEALSAEDEAFVDEFNKAEAASEEDIELLRFKNVIRKNGRCGFASGGSKDYLVNTDRGARYRVTVRTRWRQGINSGQNDRVHVIAAGSRKYLGCTDSGSIPVAYYSRSVVGEEKL